MRARRGLPAARLLASALACVLVALCQTAPSQVHLSLGDSPDELRVSWVTETQTFASIVQFAPLAGQQGVWNSTNPGSAEAGAGGARTVNGVQWRFAASTTRSLWLHQARLRCAVAICLYRFASSHVRTADFASRRVGQASLRGLQPGVSYGYRVSGDLLSWSPRFTFRAPRPRADNDAPLRLLAFCDAGVVDEARSGALDAAALDAESVQYDALLHCGDLAYDLDSQGGQTGDIFLNAMQPLVASLPWMVGPGNHEQAIDDLGERLG